MLNVFTADDDYVSDAIDVTFGVGDTSAIVCINITDDNIDEGNEAFGLVLKTTDDTPDFVEIVDPMRATGIIDDDDETGMVTLIVKIGIYFKEARFIDFYSNTHTFFIDIFHTAAKLHILSFIYIVYKKLSLQSVISM